MSAQRQRRLKSALAHASDGAQDYWTFASTQRARDLGPLFQYPAMMVSPMQGALLDAAVSVSSGQPHVYDPFVGSGTTMIEALRRGLSFSGQDINPLAILLCKVECSRLPQESLEHSTRQIIREARRREGDVAAPDAAWVEKWFRPDVAATLAALASAIREVPSIEHRRFAWATLAEVVRRCGNQRISTPKLQTRKPEELTRRLDPVQLFANQAATNAATVAGRITQNPSAIIPELILGDVRDANSLVRPADIVLTSPPYGDNHTTIPYGQASWLPLLWMDLADLGEAPSDLRLSAMRGIDHASLGGSLAVLDDDVEGVIGASDCLRMLLHSLEHRSSGWRRVGGFFADLDNALGSIASRCAPGALLVLTLGDRTVAEIPVPTTAIVCELLVARGGTVVQTVQRSIPHGRRIASRNRRSDTIGTEIVVAIQMP